MAVSPLAGITSASLRVTVSVGGSPIKDDYGIVSVLISHEVNRISFAEVVLYGETNIDDGTIPISDGTDFAPGAEIEITAGYGDSGEDSLFKGVIVKHGLEVTAEMGYQLRLQCKNKAVLMTFNETAASFAKQKDSDIISKIFGTYSISVTVDATTTENAFVLQHLSTDWDFVLARAEFNGFIITMDGTSVIVGKPLVSGSPVLTLTLGESITSFSAELSAEDQPTAIEAHAWDIKTQALITSTASEPSVNAQGDTEPKKLSTLLAQNTLKLMSPTPMTTAELKAWADGVLLRKRLAASKGTVKFVGSALAKTGALVELASTGTKFNGNAFVSGVKHTIEDGDWSTTVRFGLDNTPISRQNDFSSSPAAGQLPAIHGLQIGVVKKLSEDPDGENRIEVTIQSNAETAAAIWCRVANFYATNAAGSGFMPEVGDEVVVGFFDSDPRYPVVLGSLYSSKNVSPNAPKDENNYIKSITTKSKMEISMDDEKKVILVKTPGGNKITISDDAKSIVLEDQNSNKIQMTSSGIVLESAKDITLKATGNIKLDATGKVDLKATQDLVMAGMNINATAQMGLTAKGTATAELSASGQTTVKGAMVMIN